MKVVTYQLAYLTHEAVDLHDACAEDYHTPLGPVSWGAREGFCCSCDERAMSPYRVDMTASFVMRHSNNRYSTSAAELCLRPGKWPDALTLSWPDRQTQATRGRAARDSNGTVVAVKYSAQGVTLTVFGS